MRAIDKIKNVNNTIIQDLVTIDNGTSPNVDYATTVFGNYNNYQKSFDLIQSAMIGSQQKRLISTPLIPEQGNQRKLYVSKKDHGVGFGMIFIEYTTKKPRLVVVVDQNAYRAAKLPINSNAWENRAVTFILSDQVHLINSVVAELSIDVDSFKI